MTQYRPTPSKSAIRNLSALFDNSGVTTTKPSDNSDSINRLVSQHGMRPNSHKLEHVKLQSCEFITDKGVMVLLEHCVNLKQLDYHQKFSLLEILIKWSSNCQNSERMMQLFKASCQNINIDDKHLYHT